MKSLHVTSVGICAALALLSGAAAAQTIALQPLGKVASAELDSVRRIVVMSYPNAKVTVLPLRDLPPSAWYPSRSRWRAEKLLAALVVWKPAGFDRIAGLTEQDISTTKGPYPDWGIFGYGQIGGPACVISGFRLGKGTNPAGRARRLAWTVTHELGHTFGLEHCPVPGCLMEDAAGKAATLDRSSGLFCPRCKAVLARQGIPTR